MELDIFFSICQTDVHGYVPSEKVMFENFFDEISKGIEAQTRSCIENIRKTLEAAGSSLEKVVDVTVYLTDMKRDFDEFNRVYGEYFGRIQPTRTTVGVESLPTPISVELKVIAGG
jgi:2-aminomuconate deaminase